MQDKNKEAYNNRNYNIVPYNPEWPLQFQGYVQKIRTIFSDVQIEHIGSTSVSGMAGKPCIDVLVIVKDLEDVESCITEMEQAGFQYAGEFVMPSSRLFRVMQNTTLLANIHFFPQQHPHIKEMLELRDYLRSHPEEVKMYSTIKEELYAKYPDDYASYRKYKDEYMEELRERAKNLHSEE